MDRTESGVEFDIRPSPADGAKPAYVLFDIDGEPFALSPKDVRVIVDAMLAALGDL